MGGRAWSGYYRCMACGCNPLDEPAVQGRGSVCNAPRAEEPRPHQKAIIITTVTTTTPTEWTR